MARIALLFSGLCRQWSHCIRSQLDLFKQHEFDVFFHFWDTTDVAEKERIVQAYQPKAHAFAPQVDFSSYERVVTHVDNINPPARMLSMYYGWKAVALLFDDYRRSTGTQYDYAVRLRADLMFFRPLDELIPALGPNSLVLSTHNDFGLVNDTFALGGLDPILYYMSLYDSVASYKDFLVFNPECILIQHLNCNPLEIRMELKNIVILVFRAHMVGMPIGECLKEHPGRSKWKDAEVVQDHARFHAGRRGKEGAVHVDQFRQMQLHEMEMEKQGIKVALPPVPPIRLNVNR